MKILRQATFFFLFALGLLSFELLSSSDAHAQVPGAIISVGALGGFQNSSQTGVGSGSYLALRGSFSSLFGEIRHVSWGDNSSYIHENGILGGMDFSIWHLMVMGAVGVGQSTYQAPMVGEITPPVTPSYTSLLYEAQAMYQFEIISGIMTVGVGVNYLGESNSTAPITGWGGVASLNIGL